MKGPWAFSTVEGFHVLADSCQAEYIANLSFVDSVHHRAALDKLDTEFFQTPFVRRKAEANGLQAASVTLIVVLVPQYLKGTGDSSEMAISAENLTLSLRKFLPEGVAVASRVLSTNTLVFDIQPAGIWRAAAEWLSRCDEVAWIERRRRRYRVQNQASGKLLLSGVSDSVLGKADLETRAAQLDGAGQVRQGVVDWRKCGGERALLLGSRWRRCSNRESRRVQEGVCSIRVNPN